MSLVLQTFDILRPLESPVVETKLTLTQIWRSWFSQMLVARLNKNFSLIQSRLSPGITASIVTAKLTVGGANGSMTFTNGILTAQTPAT